MGATSKKQIKLEAPRKSKRRQVEQQPVEMSEIEKLTESWKQEIAKLQSRAFSSEDAAVAAVVGQILQKLGTPRHLLEPTRGFLHDLFDTDPALREEIRSCLRIKKS